MSTPLASIQKIHSLRPIPGADSIELGTVLGYQTVVKRGEFQEDDWCIFHLPDTIVDANNPVYSFLEKQGYRIKISKFKGVYSQGLALPLSILERFGKLEKTEKGLSLILFESVNTLDEPLPNSET